MHTVTSTSRAPEKIIVARLLTSSHDPALFDIDVQEMRMLCLTAGAQVVETVVQKRPAPEAATYLGNGKLTEIAQLMKDTGATTLAVDAELSPGQVRNMEKIVEGKVIDRSQLILDIFARHARTNEAQIQVELAQLRALLPRLTHSGTTFSQQVGGIGTRGPGEKQLELDRRTVQKKIDDLKARLVKVERSRVTQRKSRENAFRISLVGYTNAGKSSLLNALCKAHVTVENKLFATLDTATRRTYLPECGSVVASDTVGFIRKLPPSLVASFRSTLEVVREADLLLIVLDASCPWVDHQFATVNEVLKELGADRTPRAFVLNKADLVTDPFTRKKLMLAFPGAEFISALDSSAGVNLKRIVARSVEECRRAAALAQSIRREKDLLEQSPV